MKRFFAFLCCVSILLLAGCHEDPYLTVSPSNLAFGQEGGSQTVQVSANFAWTASVSGSGFKISPSSGEGAGTVTVTASAANSSDEVSGSISFQSEGLSASVALRQEARSTITVGNVSKVPAEGGTVTVDIQYNTAFDVEIESAAQSWISYAGTKSLSSGKLTFDVKANDGTDPRSGKVTIKDKGGKVSAITLTFEQEEKKVIQVGQTNTIPAEGGTFTVDVQYNTDFTVEVEKSAQSWITFIQTKALKSGKLEFSVKANETYDKRTGKVTVKDKSGKLSPITLTFEQEENKGVKVGQANTIPAEGGTFTVDVQYNTDFTVEVEKSAQSWITFVQTKALKSGKLEFSIKANDGRQRSGKVSLKDKTSKAALVEFTLVQDGINVLRKAQIILDDFYDKLDGKNWKDPWIAGKHYPGLEYDDIKGKVSLYFNMEGMKGRIPESIGELGELIYNFQIYNEPGLTGPLPDSFRKLTALESISLAGTGMTSLPDLFADMKSLKQVVIVNNDDMKGTLPYSIQSPALTYLEISGTRLTGSLPAYWAGLGTGHYSFFNNCLSGTIPKEYLEIGDAQINLQNMLWQKEGYGFDISNIDIKGYAGWPTAAIENKPIEDLDGNLFTYMDVIRNNRYTVFVSWAPWCPFSKELMPQLKDYYDLYQQDGLEVIATVMLTSTGGVWNDREGQVKEIAAKGYGKWYNFYWQAAEQYMYIPQTPAVEVYDSEGYILFSNIAQYPDPVRKRFGRNATTELIPFLETLFGPAEVEDLYASKDYSKDGEVMTLQKATVGKGIDIVFMGDGYTDKDMGKGGLYETLMNQSMEEFFAIEPYKSFRNRFNVYAVKVVSKNGRIGEGYETALATQFGNGSEVYGDYEKCVSYAKKVPSITGRDNLAIAVLVNTRRHAGMASLDPSTQSGIAFLSTNGNDPELFGSTLRHELGGHGIAFLADEYVSNNNAAPAELVTQFNELYEKYGWYANVDFTKDPKKVRWSAFLSDDRYKGEVGIYEGAAEFAKGVYRPSENSMMNQNFEYFNAPSRWAIYQQIFKRSGETPSFDKFLEYDAVNRSAAKKASESARPPYREAGRGHFVPTAPPVISDAPRRVDK